MSKNQFRQTAKSIKASLSTYMKDKKLKPLSQEKNPFHHPLAKSIKDKKIAFSAKDKALIHQCQKSAKLIITKENRKILLNYFIERRKSNDKLGELYQSLTFTDFVLRLFQKRFKEVYFDGRAVVLRNGENHSGHQGKAYLQKIGTPKDTDNIYQEYLTLEESVLSTLVLPQATSIVLGTGNRSEEHQWNIKQEFNESIDIATFSYPAAAEFRNGNTAHYDLHFIVKPQDEDPTYKKQIAQIKNNSALMKAAREIYGDTFAFESNKDHGFKTLHVGGETYYLNKNAYKARTKNVLKTVLLAADAQMQEQGLGKTFQLKGLGLGAFSFTGAENSYKLETLYIQCVKDVIKELKTSNQLKYINCVNLINLPSDYADPTLTANITKQEATISGIQLLRSVMDPTTNKHKAKIGEIGGVVVCGDSGSKFGNEGNIGLQRSSSDDPAAQYSLFNPLILDPDANPALGKKDCIQMINNGRFEQMPVPALKTIKLPKKTTTQSPNWWHIAGWGATGLIALAITAPVSAFGLGLTWGMVSCALIWGLGFIITNSIGSRSEQNLVKNEIHSNASKDSELKFDKLFTPARSLAQPQKIHVKHQEPDQYASKRMRVN